MVSKFIQRGTGQVFYLREENGGWLLEMFTGGPSGREAVVEFSNSEQALKALGEMDCSPATAAAEE